MALLVNPDKADDIALATLLRLKARRSGVLDNMLKPKDWTPLPHQVPPEGDWFAWVMMGGRGTGKTDGGAAYVNEHVMGPPCITDYPGGHRVAIIAPTIGDAVESCVNGPSGLKAHNPQARLTGGHGGVHVRWPNRVEAKLFGAYTPEDVERLRAGGNRCLVWAEELAAWSKLAEVWDHMMFGLRLGSHPRVVVTTTPKPKPKLKELLKSDSTVVTHGTTNDNPYLHESVRKRFMDTFGGTRLGRQELLGELIEDVEGALWNMALLEQNRVPAPQEPDAWELLLTTLHRVVTAVDPSGGDEEGNAEVGIIAAGKGMNGHGYVLKDGSARLGPKAWASAAVKLYHQLKADKIVAEANFGGAMVEYTIKTIDPTVPVRMVSASRGKRARAEPIASLDEQGRIHHVGLFPKLEDQMTTWVPDSGEPSPDRMDARVWALTDLLLEGSDVMVY